MAVLPLVGAARAPDLHVMTFNIRRRLPHLNRRSPDAWERRKWVLQQLLETEQPTILGVQEALPDQVAFATDSLGPAYRALGYGRMANGRGEQCALIYDSERLQLMEWTQLALSDTPHLPGSRSWGNLIPRVLVTADLRDVATGVRWRVLNTHLDPLSKRSRARSARMLVRLTAAREWPTIVLGDFNAEVGSVPYRLLTAAGMLNDSWRVTSERVSHSWGTYSRYRSPQRGGKRLDWLLASDNIAVRASAINVARTEGTAASDHEPVQALVRARSEQSGP